ncbi:hypothetical protein BVC80_8695g9 [Macleaya cordata]|uniref:Retrotransposon Copia-like N-terminal domain-containing protein n=1 Tax=Macleaya cordata TaxID=56857 RepID=A0A200PPT3_MACCD|nr:hypothetical protein BVC80_8695g9 [Macleaya cordata]
MASSSASSSTTTPVIPSSSLVPLFSNLNHPIVNKLDRNNYLLWHNQMVPILKSHKPYKHVDKDFLIPLTTISDPTTTNPIPNPAFDEWESADLFLLGWLLDTLTDPVHTQVIGLRTCREVWLALEKSFANQNAARVLQIKG